MIRKKTKLLYIGKVPVGGGAPVSIQSMCNTPTADAVATIEQIKLLAQAGCDIVRVAVPDDPALAALPQILDAVDIPLVADIHFDHELALGAIRCGVDALRLNPGNISSPDKLKMIAEAAGEKRIPIRVGANSGSVRPALLKKYSMAQVLVESALEQCALLEQFGFSLLKVSLKSSNVVSTVEACRIFSQRSDYPQHIGITEAGSLHRGSIKSAVGLGALLFEGIGDTLRVSLTADPLEEVAAARLILESAGLREADYDIISCPSCGRTSLDLIELAGRVESLMRDLAVAGHRFHNRKIAVMGCAVNGPGEAREADIGLAGANDGRLLLFEKGEVVGVYTAPEAFKMLKKLIIDW